VLSKPALSLLAAVVQPGLTRSPCCTSILFNPILRRASCLVACLLVHRRSMSGALHSLLGRLAGCVWAVPARSQRPRGRGNKLPSACS